MFKKFDGGSDVSGSNQAKSSVVRAIRASITERYPMIGENQWLDKIMPKKEPVQIVKCRDHIELVVVKGELLFFKQRDGPYLPTLKLLHKYPDLLPKVQVDKGAIRFILSGANVMCPGLTSPGARMDTPLSSETIVAVMAEGKELAVCVGLTKLSTEDIATINKGVGIESIHYLGDGLWRMKDHV